MIALTRERTRPLVALLCYLLSERKRGERAALEALKAVPRDSTERARFALHRLRAHVSTAYAMGWNLTLDDALVSVVETERRVKNSITASRCARSLTGRESFLRGAQFHLSRLLEKYR